MEKTNTNQSPTQNPSKVVIVPKPPKGKVEITEAPEAAAEELVKAKVETVKPAKDTVVAGNKPEPKAEVKDAK